MKSTHSPGQWTYGVRRDGSIWLSIGDPLMTSHSQFDLLCVSEADARLIASAPALLAALRGVLRAADAARDAIAKATGEHA